MPLEKGKSPEAFKHNLKAEIKAGKPMKQSLAIAYSMKKKAKKMAQGGVVEHEEPSAIEEDDKELNQHADPFDNIVERVMVKRYSKGGMVANGGDDELSEMADGKPANYDDLALRDTLSSENSGAADGDFLGDEAEDHDRSDIVARVMKSRAKKDRNPRPA